MKKTFSVSILALSVVLLFLISVQVNKTEDTNLPGIYLMSKKCPAEYVEYARENIRRYINSLDPSDKPSVKDLKLGNPFSFCNTDSDLFYFPVISNGSITHMLRVYKKSNGEYGAAIGKSFVEEINDLASKTSKTSPLILMMENDTAVAYVNKERTVIHEYPSGSVESETYILPSEFEKYFNAKNSDYITVNIISDVYDISSNDDHFIIRSPLFKHSRMKRHTFAVFDHF